MTQKIRRAAAAALGIIRHMPVIAFRGLIIAKLNPQNELKESLVSLVPSTGTLTMANKELDVGIDTHKTLGSPWDCWIMWNKDYISTQSWGT